MKGIKAVGLKFLEIWIVHFYGLGQKYFSRHSVNVIAREGDAGWFSINVEE